jgi:hypothetical protein
MQQVTEPEVDLLKAGLQRGLLEGSSSSSKKRTAPVNARAVSPLPAHRGCMEVWHDDDKHP